MKHKVFASFENEYNAHCVDVSQRADGSFGYEEFRRDAEDCGAWQSLASYSQQVFEVQAQALADANCCVNWPAIKARRVQALEALASLTQKSAVPRMRSGFFIELPRTGMALQTLISFWALRAPPARAAHVKR